MTKLSGVWHSDGHGVTATATVAVVVDGGGVGTVLVAVEGTYVR